MKISVIIPSYKPKEYLWECLGSLCKQTMDKRQFEILLVLNGCCEPYKSQIEAYIAKNMQGMNVRFIQTDQGGVSNARNIGIDEAKGEYLAFIDDDDYVSENYLKGLYETALRGVMSVSNMKAFVDGKPGFIPYTKESLFQVLKGKTRSINEMRKFMSVPVAKMLLAKGTVGPRRFNTSFKNGEDSLFMFLISDKIDKIECSVEDAIYYRRFRENSAMTAKKTLSYTVKNRLSLAWEYSKIYFKHPSEYNFIFFITRILACIKTILTNL